MDDTLLGVDTLAPFSLSWDSRTAPNGGHGLTARAYDATGNTALSVPVSVTLDNDFTPPTLALTAPANGATVMGTVTVSASASDNVGVTKVEFYAGSTLLGSDTTAPYSVSWNTSGGPNGPRTLTARAYDAMGYSTTSAPVSVTVDNDLTPPTVALTSPQAGATLTGFFALGATASDDRGTVSQVSYYLDGVFMASVSAAPYAYNYNSRYKPNGPHTLTATARDPAGNVGTSSSITVTFDNDLTAPTTAITAPAAGATVSGTVLIEASASDERSAISKVEFYLGPTLLGTDTTAPYAWSWDTRSRANGAYTLKTRAYDAAGNASYSTALSVTVSN
jgi:hypothetical protein